MITQDFITKYSESLGKLGAGFYDLVLLARENNFHEGSGLSFQEWVQKSIGPYIRLPIEDRQEKVTELAGKGLSQRAIADVLGVNQATVQRDLQADANASEEPEDPQGDDREVDANASNHLVANATGSQQPLEENGSSLVANATENSDLTVICGDALTELRKLPAESVQCCVTSPPYWGLRDYGTGKWEGGDPECKHLGEPFSTSASINANCGTGRDVKNATKLEPMGPVCFRCGATRIDIQLGLEPTPELYITKMVEVFREVRRILRDDGTAWVNMGDSYATSGYSPHPLADGVDRPPINWSDGTRSQGAMRTVGNGSKPKDLCGIPWRLALALQADGWYLRSEIIWHKPNPVPESVTDRPTKSHETIFLLAKSERYYYDAEAVKEVAGEIRSNRIIGKRNQDGTFRNDIGNLVQDTGFRNRRSVWTIPTQPYSGAHFATFPEKLVEPCILAGSKSGDTILDPFAGSGTTGKVALELGRSATLIELNHEYIKLIKERCALTTH